MQHLLQHSITRKHGRVRLKLIVSAVVNYYPHYRYRQMYACKKAEADNFSRNRLESVHYVFPVRLPVGAIPNSTVIILVDSFFFFHLIM